MLISKGLLVFLAVATVLAVAAVAPYFYVFDGPYSQSSQDWANFGGYVGGTLGPLYAILAFAAAAQAILDSRQQAARQALLMAIQRYETEFDFVCARTVTCKAPWVWGNSPKGTTGLESVSLRTLLYSDSIDWQRHLWPLITGNGFRVLSTGEISQDREVVFAAQCALDGISKYLALYESAGGDAPLIEYIRSRYEVPMARLEAATEAAAESLAEISAEEAE